jgi:hypothetical protein
MSARPVIRRLAQLDDAPATLGAGDTGKALVWQNSTTSFVATAVASQATVDAHAALGPTGVHGITADAAAGTASLRTLGTGATQAAVGNHGHAAADVTSGVFAIGRLATGTPDGTKFVRDDGTLAVPAAGDPTMGGDLSGPASAAVVTDDSHAHTTATISGLDAADVTTGTFAAARIPSVTAAMVAADVATQAELDASVLLAPLLAPATAARNTFQPSADVPALTLKDSSAGTTARLEEWQQSDATPFASVHPGISGLGRFELRNTGSGNGPHVWTHSLNVFNGTPDPVNYVGYNIDTGGVAVVSGKGYLATACEGDYNDGSNRLMEWYPEGMNNAGTKQARPFYASFLKTATTSQTFLGDVTITGGTNGIKLSWLRDVAGTPTYSDMVWFSPNYFQVNAVDSTQNTVFRMKAATGHVSQILLGDENVDDMFAINTESTTQVGFFVGAGPQVRALTIYRASGGSAVAVGGADNLAQLTVINSQGTGNNVAVIRGKSGQTAGGALFTVEKSDGTDYFAINGVGQVTLGDAINVALNATTGTKIGTATGEKLAFHNSTPVIQRAGAAQAAVATTGATITTPFGYTTAAQADAIVTLVNEIRATLVEKGLMKGAA